jgi:hypothetical protein
MNVYVNDLSMWVSLKLGLGNADGSGISRILFL